MQILQGHVPMRPEVDLTVPDYYRDHLDAKIAEIQTILEATPEREAFIFLTDIHIADNSGRSFGMMDEIVRRTGIRKIFCGGDVPYAFGTKEECLYDIELARKMFAKMTSGAEIYQIRGNHDYTIRTGRTETIGYTMQRAQTYATLMDDQASRVCGVDGAMYYYVDDAETKTRYIVLDTSDSEQEEEQYWGVNYGIHQAQTDWLVRTLEDTPDGWTLFVLGHIPTVPEVQAYSPAVAIAAEILSAAAEHRVLDCTDETTGTTVKADFTGRGLTVAGYFCGHNHWDTSVISDGVLHVSTCCDAYFRDDPNNLIREPGTVTEQCFDVVIRNRQTGRIDAVRIGAGKNRVLDPGHI